MGFLYQVLKDVSEKQPYNVGKNTLNSVSSVINKHLCSGHDGFTKLLPSLTKHIEKYNKEVRESNKAVSNPINELIKYVKDRGELLGSINKYQVTDNIEQDVLDAAEKTMAEKLKECQKKAETLNSVFNLSTQTDMKNAISYLNSTLSERVRVALRAVSHETERLKTMSGKERKDLDGLQEKIKSVLSALGNCVNEKIQKDIENLVKQLKEGVNTILKHLKDIDGQLREHVQKLEEWMESAKKEIDRIRNEDVKKILDETTDGITGTTYLIKDDAKKVKDWEKKLSEEIARVKGELAKLVQEALRKVKSMDEALKGDLWKVKDAVNKQVTGIKEAIGKLYDVVESGDAHATSTKADGMLSNVIGSIRSKVAQMKTDVGENGKNSDQKTGIFKPWDELKNKLNELVSNIYFKKGTKGNLYEVERNITEYAKDFVSEALKNKVLKTWMDVVLGDHGTAHQYINLYVEDNTGKGYFKDEGNLKQNVEKTIRKVFDSKLKAVLSKVPAVENPESSNLVTNLGNIKRCLRTLWEHLKGGMKTSDLTSSKIVTEIIGQYAADGLVESTNNHTKTHLYSAVKYIVSGIADMAEQAETEILWLVKDSTVVKQPRNNSSIAANIDASIKRIDDFVTQFNGNPGHGGLGNKMEEALYTVKHRIQKLHQHLSTAVETSGEGTAAAVDSAITGVTSKLEEQLPKEQNNKLGTHVKLGEGPNMFDGYKEYVKQDTSILQKQKLDGTSAEGSLPAAIGDIGSAASDIYITHITSGLTALSEKIKQDLDTITKAITTTTKNVQSKLDDFKNKKLGNAAHSKPAQKDTLQELHCKFLDLHKYFESKALKTAEAFAAYADRSGKNIIDPLKQHVNNEVKKAQDSIISEAKKNYISSIQSLLQRFASKVHSELEALPKSIEDDLTLGFKGFMVKFEMSFITNEKSIKGIKDIETTSPQKESPLRQAATKFFGSVNRFLHGLETQPDFKTDYEKIKPTREALAKLFGGLVTSEYFDHEFSRNLSALKVTLSELKPAIYGEAKCPLLLNALKNGLSFLVDTLDKTYISAYDSETFSDDLVKGDNTLTKYGKYYAKVFLTALRTLDVSLYGLKHECKSLTGQKINSSTDLGRLFVRHGFKVAEENKEHWELQNRTVISGAYVSNRINYRVSGAKGNEHLKQCESKKRNDDHFNVFDMIRCLVTHVKQYFEVCHYSTSTAKRQPCSVYEMLIWLSGLPHNKVYDALLTDGLSAPFEDPDKQTKEVDGDADFTVSDLQESHLDAYPKQITYKSVAKVLDHVCSASYDVLTTIAGTGNVLTTYAVDYCTNSHGLYYPSTGEDCLHTVLDILRRLLPQLRYLFNRCNVKAENYGWRDCRYGSAVDFSTWQCNDHSSDESNTKPNDQPNSEPNSEPNCRPTSPLMSYLNDCLPGHLPHRLTSIGCKSECKTCPGSKPGMPCLTPLGFRAFSGSTKTGISIYETLWLFFGNGLISSLFCLVPTPPRTLPEHFQFALCLGRSLNGDVNHSIKNVFESSIDDLSIKLYDPATKFTDALRDVYGNNHNHKSARPADLSSLSTTTSCVHPKRESIYCSPYLAAQCQDYYSYLASKYANVYLSWALYLPWALFKYLQSLLQDFRNISCRDSGCHGCTQTEICKGGQHGVDYNCRCYSVVKCRGVASIFYSYGFAFGDSKQLLEADEQRRYCYHFYNQLQNVLKSKYFETLFTECDNFLFTIRQPFIWLNVALWSLSLFYLICVMVGRLDVLHIKSHLRIPSSHKITAQSLLAAAQVGRLAKISYLQP
ncbi:hypothetical protein, conserved [Babesia bigemina]|uniref:C3H1-type domain-containing protein n=1 Tax=Babesia bigemina TaxID=5866 RepID=A0A061BK23_BABBI|nr:hypothetical protein, conserved [Babesia bigemina]CDR71835.1 hypothetical protein, conserved [Babesia bigemina]|eukprot:XP_012770778.1 hypothetical protein, conserved [Babesia bigemina]